MGWTYQCAKFYNANGSINRKAECDNILNHENDRYKSEVLKSAMKGSVYYAAVRSTNKETGYSDVWAAIFLTSTNKRDYYNFGYKDMEESMGPYNCDCPKAILELLSETDNEYAINWRKACWENVNKPKQKSLSSVKIGEVIEFQLGMNKVRVRKMPPSYQFKTPWYKKEGENVYVKRNHIKDWVVVESV